MGKGLKDLEFSKVVPPATRGAVVATTTTSSISQSTAAKPSVKQSELPSTKPTTATAAAAINGNEKLATGINGTNNGSTKVLAPINKAVAVASAAVNGTKEASQPTAGRSPTKQTGTTGITTSLTGTKSDLSKEGKVAAAAAATTTTSSAPKVGAINSSSPAAAPATTKAVTTTTATTKPIPASNAATTKSIPASNANTPKATNTAAKGAKVEPTLHYNPKRTLSRGYLLDGHFASSPLSHPEMAKAIAALSLPTPEAASKFTRFPKLFKLVYQHVDPGQLEHDIRVNSYLGKRLTEYQKHWSDWLLEQDNSLFTNDQLDRYFEDYAIRSLELETYITNPLAKTMWIDALDIVRGDPTQNGELVHSLKSQKAAVKQLELERDKLTLQKNTLEGISRELQKKYKELQSENKLFKENASSIPSSTNKELPPGKESATIKETSPVKEVPAIKDTPLPRKDPSKADEPISKAEEEHFQELYKTMKSTFEKELQQTLKGKEEKYNSLKSKFKAFMEEYQTREKHFNAVTKTKDSEYSLIQAKFDLLNEKLIDKGADLDKALEKIRKQEERIQNFHVENKGLIYKLKDAEDTLSKSNETFMTYRTQLDLMTEKLKGLSKEHTLMKKSTLDLDYRCTFLKESLVTSEEKNKRLESLSRALQTELQKERAVKSGGSGDTQPPLEDL